MGVLLALLTAFSYSVSNVCIKKGMVKSKGDNGFFITVVINSFILGIAALIYRLVSTDSITITFYGLFLFALAGIFATFLGRITLFKSFREIGPTRGVAIKNSAPLFAILFAIIFLHEVIHFIPFIGTLFVLLGLGIQAYYLLRQDSPSNLNNEEANLKKGYFFALFSAVVFGVGQAIRKPGLTEIPDPFFGAFIGSLTALIIISLYEWKKGVLRTTVANQIAHFNLFYLLAGVFTSLAMLFFFIAISYLQVSYVVAIAATEPLITIILSKFLLKNQEVIARYTIVSSLTVFVGVLIIIMFN